MGSCTYRYLYITPPHQSSQSPSSPHLSPPWVPHPTNPIHPLLLTRISMWQIAVMINCLGVNVTTYTKTFPWVCHWKQPICQDLNLWPSIIYICFKFCLLTFMLLYFSFSWCLFAATSKIWHASDTSDTPCGVWHITTQGCCYSCR